ncbi:hypothetical protein [Paenibacillus chitinolyticus]
MRFTKKREIPAAGDLELLSMLETTYAVVTCRGSREEMMNLYDRLE